MNGMCPNSAGKVAANLGADIQERSRLQTERDRGGMGPGRSRWVSNRIEDLDRQVAAAEEALTALAGNQADSSPLAVQEEGPSVGLAPWLPGQTREEVQEADRQALNKGVTSRPSSKAVAEVAQALEEFRVNLEAVRVEVDKMTAAQKPPVPKAFNERRTMVYYGGGFFEAAPGSVRR